MPWDYAAGSLLVEEAGGYMATVDGQPFHTHSSSVLATSSVILAKEVQEVLKPILLDTPSQKS